MTATQHSADEKTTVFARLAEISLEENPSTGSRWNLILPPALSLVDDRYIPDEPVRPGSGGTRVFIVRASKSGTYEVSAILQRPWEPNPIETRKIVIVVQ
ncbi:protease inhibitor I42 family protein [Rhodococcus sp. ABRD24]|uniref:protease inhibitor I42 family protein n=1 Tax=Rhodococcus sp. ABRD24 TaxID=2507582 RepID=UPI0013F1724D|nr:protease inhibitor I42 family protein [Rhodococcus sp. ABRD24]